MYGSSIQWSWDGTEWWTRWTPFRRLHFHVHFLQCKLLYFYILINFSLKYVRKGPIENNPSLVQIMAWRRLGDKPLSEPMMISLPTHICVSRPPWVNPTISISSLRVTFSRDTRARLNINMSSSQFRNYHYKNRPSADRLNFMMGITMEEGLHTKTGPEHHSARYWLVRPRILNQSKHKTRKKWAYCLLCAFD